MKLNAHYLYPSVLRSLPETNIEKSKLVVTLNYCEVVDDEDPNRDNNIMDLDNQHETPS
jgi:hypothetical protein